MLDFEKCKKIKNECTKKYTENHPKIIINLEHHPLIYLIFLDEGKSRGIFVEKDSIYCLGKRNIPICHSDMFLFNTRVKWKDSFFECEVIHNNPEVKKVFSKVIEYAIIQGFNPIYLIIKISYINPILLANLVDGDCFYGRQKPWTNDEIFKLFYRAVCYGMKQDRFDLTQSQIKKAFHMPSKWVRAYLSNRSFYDLSGFKAFECLKANNFTPEEVQSFINHLGNIPEKYFHNKDLILRYSYNGTYRDYFNMWVRLPEVITKDFPIMPENTLIWHTRIMPLYFSEACKPEKEEIRIAQDRYTQNFYKEAVKFEFSDEEYSIIACNNLEDLHNEGRILHHCVGSYVNSVSNGREYILFLRKNTDINTPYFTIDVTPDKKVRQIHGLCNCEISEEIRPFIETWAKHFELSLSDCNEVRCALL